MIKKFLTCILSPCLILFITSCQQDVKNASSDQADSTKSDSSATVTETAVSSDKQRVPADAAAILARKQVPILCYHQIRDWKPRDSKGAKDYIVPVSTFKEHIKMLADSGYHSVLPEQVYNYLLYGDPLPPKPVMITFDDNEENQFVIANAELKKYGFKAVYFIMTVSLGRPNYMSREQVKQLSDEGNTIASHTWDHHNVKKYQGEDWVTQIEKPTKTLKEITGKEIEYFAYPFGLWNKEAIPELKKRGMKAAFILATKRDDADPLFTIRRIIASGYWSARTLHNSMVNSFGEKRN
ncbi:polysaccharide deacetylase [Arcticibacter tournemirensis]|uniref:Polysaccharide deacetylase family protein n=1 Tax=Arcticibacter tournemirensis TaxID=699437 RepID=A0A4Q0MA34_9SPHI|nr:polysaccharide deacetylase family protein [Arcticibacter tournemirensis]KAA8483806.1 polysaccharide deacetylase family protein [Arcticibacter tournemirensis]RXF69659.1 polysaccharide deacetylase family protein [Arcticibacter tournemirensis]TQM49988.1 polysaccharide deacetylase [Arcticibacter tournemirensis]